MKRIKRIYDFYTVFKWLGNLATFLFFFLVLMKTGHDYSNLFWMVPLLGLVKFGCYAEHDRKRYYGK